VGGSDTVVNTEIAPTTDDWMPMVVNTLTVANIVNIRSDTHPALATSIVNTAIGDPINALVADNISGFVVGQPLNIQSIIQDANTMSSGKIYQIRTLGVPPTNYTDIGAVTGEVGEVFTYNGNSVTGSGTVLLAEFGGLSTLGQVYYVNSIDSITGQFTVRTTPEDLGVIVTLYNDVGAVIASVGAEPTTRITTGIPHNLIDNELVRIDGVKGAIQLNNNTYYAKVINATVVDIYLQPYDPAWDTPQAPVILTMAYISGGYIWRNGLFTLKTTYTQDTSTRYITVDSTALLVVGTPVYFSKPGLLNGDTTIGGLIVGQEYYISEINTINEFSVASYRGGPALSLAPDTDSVIVTQWTQSDVNRLWVTINGARVSTTSLRLNPANELSILSTIVPGDEVIITNMIPTATPSEDTYLLNVNSVGAATVFRENPQSTTWLVRPLEYTDEVIYLDDISSVTKTIVQESYAPSFEAYPYDNTMYIGLIGNKNLIASVTVYNNTKGAIIDPTNYSVIVRAQAPVIEVVGGPWIAPGDSLTITIVEGNLIFLDGEYIKFTQSDPVENTLFGLQRGVNGTGRRAYIAQYACVYGILSSDQMNTIQYQSEWNSYHYNSMQGDPLQISLTDGAEFLRRFKS